MTDRRFGGLAGVAVLGAAVVTGCMAAGGATEPSPQASPSAQAAAASPDAGSTVAVEVPADCPLTRPDPEFLAPPPWPERPPAAYGAAWYGTADLWTMLDADGEEWSALPRRARDGRRYVANKSFWWSARWVPSEELEPAISVSGIRLDGSGSFETAGPGTNAFADFGAAMLTGVEIPAEGGCWRLTGRYRDAELSYVVWIEPAG